MRSTVNLYFVLIIIFIYYLYKNRSIIYLKNLRETFYGDISNTLDINFIDNKKNFKKKNLYIYETVPERDIPILYTNFKYSLEYKLGYEISRIFKINFSESRGLNYNLTNLIENQNNLLLCSESDFMRNKHSDYKFVCSFYPLYFLLFCRAEFDINNWNDIKYYNSNVEYLRRTFSNFPENLRIGIPNKDNNSYNDAKYLFNSIKINIEDSDEIQFIFDTEKNLFNRLKLPITDNNGIDIVYLTTSYKNPYLEEYMRGNNINIIGNKGLKESLINGLYNNNNILKKNIDTKKYTDISKRKNIYANLIGNEDEGNVFNSIKKIKLFRNLKEEKIISIKPTNTYSTRLILIAHKNFNKDYITLLLRNIYGSIDNIRQRLNKYLLVRNNTLEDCMEPYEMAFCPISLEYHNGAVAFYKEIDILADETNIKDNIFEKENNKHFFSKLL